MVSSYVNTCPSGPAITNGIFVYIYSYRIAFKNSISVFITRDFHLLIIHINIITQSVKPDTTGKQLSVNHTPCNNIDVGD